MTAARHPRAYLDWNASAPLRPEARAAMLGAMDVDGNPSSVHAEGRRLRAIVEEARERVARLVGVRAGAVVFTGGATEAAHYALTPDWRGAGIARPAGRLYVGAIEHPCVLRGGRMGPSRTRQIPARADGRIDLDALAAALAAHDRASGRPLVAVMAANNETGVIQPAAEAMRMARGAGGYGVCDAVQAAGRIPISASDLGASAILLSSHKIGGPKGVGALVLPEGEIEPSAIFGGGGQERGARAGTENVAAIAGFGAAAEAALAGLARAEAIRALRDRLEAGVMAATPAACIIGESADRLPNTSCIALPRVSAEMLVIALDLGGVAVSAGAACSSGKVARSHVLEAMGLSPGLAASAIRVSLGDTTGADDIEHFLAAWQQVAASPALSGAA